MAMSLTSILCILMGIEARPQDWTACSGVPSQLSMRDSHHLLMSILTCESIGHHLLPMLPLGQNMTATALHGMAAPKQTQFQMTDTTVRWAMRSALTTQNPVMTLVHVAWRAGSAYTKWLGHPLVHVLLRVKACRNPRWHATYYHVHLGKVKAHAGVKGNILANAAAKQVVT